MRKKDYAGMVFGRLTVIEPRPSVRGKTLWLCKCDCGSEKVYSVANLANGNTMSCGCLHREMASQLRTTHGLTRTPEGKAWESLRQRCNNPKSPQYKDYGGRGIKVCERWASLAAFFADMGPRPSPDHSLDRIDVNGGYEPTNCRWATRTEQQNNRTDNRVIVFDGVTSTLMEHCKRLGLKYGTALWRLNRGHPVEIALWSGSLRSPEYKTKTKALKALAVDRP